MVEYNIADALKSVSVIFESHKIPWLIHAGFGMYLYGIKEADTHDIDVVLPTVNLEEAEKVISSFFDTQVVARGRTFSHGIYNSQCLKAVYKDVTIEMIHDIETVSHGNKYSSHFNRDSIANKTNIKRYGLNLPVAPIEDIILYKLILQRGETDGKQDLYEVARALQQEIDLEYLREKAQMVGAEELLVDLDRYTLTGQQD